MPEHFRERVLDAVRSLRPGEVVSYGDVAAQAGYPGAARGVGAVLSAATEAVPWWRVVYADGRLAPGKEDEQGRRLRAEGVRVDACRVRAGTDAPGAGRPSRGGRTAGTAGSGAGVPMLGRPSPRRGGDGTRTAGRRPAEEW